MTTLNFLWVISFRDLLRNKRRTFFSFFAVSLGLALLIVLNGLIAGIIEDSVQNNIRLKTGHIQIRSASYQEEKLSLQSRDLLQNTNSIMERLATHNEVKAAAPVLWFGGILNMQDDSVNLQLFGIDLNSALYAPIREGITTGEFLNQEDRDGILIGKRLADSLEISIGQKINLTAINSDGNPIEGNFTIRGLFSTGIPSYDENSAFLSISKAQAFTHSNSGAASAIVILLHNQEDAEKINATLQSPGTITLTWKDLNKILVQFAESGMQVYIILDAIVILIVAIIIANTLLMAVFERIREMGILSSLGMKGNQILGMILFEASILGITGVLFGIFLGCGVIAYLSRVGIYIGDVGKSSGSIALGTVMYAHFVPSTIAMLSLWTFIIILSASLYPATFASRLEPVEALHA